MSAIFGILRFDGAAVNPRDLERMGNVLAHRGPDGRKFIIDGAVGLGHCLMRVNEEDVFEAQPLRDAEADLTLVADCRIDNRVELATAFGLNEADIRDLPDSAFILRAYQKWGEDAAEHLIGDFAIAVWDGRTKKLILARDHMGQRYVHYHRGKDFFAFSTEIKALWALADVPRALDDMRIGCFILGDLSPAEGATIFSGIAGLVGGSTLSVGRDGRHNTRYYWEPHAGAEHLHRDEAYYVETYARVFAEAVSCRVRRLIAPPALMLSGGFDSAAIAGLSAPHLKGRKLIAVSSVMQEGYAGPARDARPWVDVCKRAMPHLDVHYYVRGDATIFTGLEQRLATADGLWIIGDHVTDGLYALAAGAGARLMMDGICGDEALNPRGNGHFVYLLRSGRLHAFMREFGAYGRATGLSPFSRLRAEIRLRAVPLWLRWLVRDLRRGFRPRWSESFIAPGLARTMRKAGALAAAKWLSAPFKRSRPGSEWQFALPYVSSMPAPHHAAAAARWNLTVSRPTMDKRVIEFALAVPVNLRVRNGYNRYLARTALADILPKEFQTRGWQQDLVMPDGAAMVAEALARMKTESAQLAKDEMLARYVDFSALQRALESAPPTKLDLWPVLMVRAFQAARYAAWFLGRNR
jgi:asparagine synthase (glutamine-hydrolysing)